MTTNFFDDNVSLWAAAMNGILNHIGGETILSGCSISKGTGDWETDISSGQVRVGGSTVAISADTVTHTEPSSDADMDTGEARIDLITVDSGDNISITEGSAAADPASPDIPANEVLLGFWFIEESDGSLSQANIFDIPAGLTAEHGDLDGLSDDDHTQYLNGSRHDARDHSSAVGSAELDDLENTPADWWSIADWGRYSRPFLTHSLDGGSVTHRLQKIEFRNPGDGSAVQRQFVYENAFTFDPSVSGSIELLLANVNFDNSANARFYVGVRDNPAGAGTTGDSMVAQIAGDGLVNATVSQNGSATASSDNTEDNAFINGVQSVKVEWDGSTFTVTVDDGTTQVVVSESGNYPSGETLAFQVFTDDAGTGAANNIDLDITDVIIT